jgi:hypothetical protein
MNELPVQNLLQEAPMLTDNHHLRQIQMLSPNLSPNLQNYLWKTSLLHHLRLRWNHCQSFQQLEVGSTIKLSRYMGHEL